MKKDISRRNFLKILGGSAVGAAAVMTGCKSKSDSKAAEEYKQQVEPPTGKMTYRTNPKTGDKVSVLGYGMMRLPSKTENKDDYDQDMINRQIDYALEHGLNYIDTSPVYCQGKSEACTGIALSRHKRSEYFVATKLSNFHPSTQSREASIGMYQNSLKQLQVDYIDYYLLHAIGGGMDEFNRRYVDNGMMDYLMKEREAGRIRNLGFSFHGYKEVFDEVLAMHDKYHWDFVQIELNYLDWDYANEINERNVDASYLYAELQKKGIWPTGQPAPVSGNRPEEEGTRAQRRIMGIPLCRNTRGRAHRTQWHDLYGASEGQPVVILSLGAIDRERTALPGQGCCRAHRRSGEYSLQRLQILHAVSLRHRHPCHFRTL